MTRLVCTLPAFHGGTLHHNGWTGWSWSTRRNVDGSPPTPVRVWECRGLVDQTAGERCRRTPTHPMSEDQARVSGWRIGVQPNGQPDPLCPTCVGVTGGATPLPAVRRR